MPWLVSSLGGLSCLVITGGVAWEELVNINDMRVDSYLDFQVGPTAVMNGCKASSPELEVEAAKLNANSKVVAAVLRQVRTRNLSSSMLLFFGFGTQLNTPLSLPTPCPTQLG